MHNMYNSGHTTTERGGGGGGGVSEYGGSFIQCVCIPSELRAEEVRQGGREGGGME